MADSETPFGRPSTGGLGTRIVVGLVLAALALAAIYFGGTSFAFLVAAAVLLTFREWAAMHGLARRTYIAGMAVIAAVILLTVLGKPFEALLLLCAGILLLSLVARDPFVGAGIAYAGLPAIALIWLRSDQYGFSLVLWTMALVWATDTCAYFAGRAIGGPKIWPAVSPSKTWAGLIGGMIGAAAVSVAIARWAHWAQPPLVMALLGAALAVVAQAGDFLESWLKRRAGIKDSGNLLPGHGGVMDRIDGLVPVAIVVALWVTMR